MWEGEGGKQALVLAVCVASGTTLCLCTQVRSTLKSLGSYRKEKLCYENLSLSEFRASLQAHALP